MSETVNLNALPGLFFGQEVQRARANAGWSQSELAERTGFSDAMIGYVEHARRAPTQRFAAACDVAFDAGSYFTRLALLARRFGGLGVELSELLRSATALRTSDPLFVPELLQTPDYAHALLAASHVPEPDREKAIQMRPRLADLLAGSPDLLVWAVMDETALYRPVGGSGVLRVQLRRLLLLVDTGRVVVQLLPAASASGALLRMPVTVLSFAHGGPVAYLPNPWPLDPTVRYTDAAPHDRMFDLLRATALSPGVSRGAIAKAIR